MTASSLNLLAFGFASPALLGWLALAAVPVLIHWLFRRRYRQVTWAAMQFLHEAARKQSRKTRLEQLLLLATRVMILTLVVLAFAQPRWSESDKSARESPPTLRVIVLDASLSMGRQAAQENADVTALSGSTLFEVGKSIAREFVKKSRAGDRFALARIAATEPRVLIRQPTLVSSNVLEEIDRLPLTFERGDVAATLRQLTEVLAARQPLERCEVVVISDFQAEAGNVEHVSNVLKLDGHVGNVPHEWVLVDVGHALPENGAVVGLTTEPSILVAEQPMSVTASLRNAGSVAITGRKLELRIDEQLIDSKRLDIPVGQDAAIEFSLLAPASGEHSMSVRLEDDSLAADNERWLPLSVRSELSVLLINGRPAARPRDAATFFVEQALAPKSNARESKSSWLRVHTLPDSELPNVDLGTHDVVFLCDVATLTNSDVERLRRFAQSGGGVVLSLGPTSSIERLNEVAFGPRGLMSLSLGELVTKTNDDGTPAAFGFDPGDFSHPLLRAFRGNPGAGLETALIRQFVRVADSREVALRFSNGDPAIVTEPLGRGRCVLVTTSLDETWGEWAIWAAGFVPLLHELTEFAATGRSQPREALVGEFIERDVSTDSTNVTLTTPEGNRRPLTPSDREGRLLAVINDTLRPGNYTLTSGANLDTTERFAINVDPRESDSRRIDLRAWSESRSERSDAVVIRSPDSLIPQVLEGASSESSSLTLGLLATVLGLLFFEQALAWKFSSGVIVAALATALAAASIVIRLLH